MSSPSISNSPNSVDPVSDTSAPPPLMISVKTDQSLTVALVEKLLDLDQANELYDRLSEHRYSYMVVNVSIQTADLDDIPYFKKVYTRTYESLLEKLCADYDVLWTLALSSKKSPIIYSFNQYLSSCNAPVSPSSHAEEDILKVAIDSFLAQLDPSDNTAYTTVKGVTRGDLRREIAWMTKGRHPHRKDITIFDGHGRDVWLDYNSKRIVKNEPTKQHIFSFPPSLRSALQEW
jgi:hypothetical protein